MEETNTIGHEKQSIYQNDDEFLKEFDTLFNLAFIEKRKLTLTNKDDLRKFTFTDFLTSTPQSSTENKHLDVNFEVDSKKQLPVKGSEGCSSNSSSSGISEEDGYNSNNSNKKKCIASCKKINKNEFSETYKIIDSLLEPITTTNSINYNSNNDNTINRNDLNEYDNLIISPKFSNKIFQKKGINSNSLVTVVKNNEIDMDEFLELVKSKTKYDQYNKKYSSMSTTSSTSLLSNEEKFYHHRVIQRNNDDTDLDESDDFGPVNSSMVEENHQNQNFVTLTSVLKSSSKKKSSSLAAKEASNNLFIDDISSIQNDIAATETCIKTFKSSKSTRSYKRKNSNYNYHPKTSQNESLQKNLSNTLIQLLIMILAINNNNQFKKPNKSNYLSKLNKMRKYKYNNSNISHNSSSSINSNNKNNLLNVSNDLLKKAIDYQLLDLLSNNLSKQNEMSKINNNKYCCSYNKSNSLTIQHHHLNNLYSQNKSKNNKNPKFKRHQQSQINHRLNLLEIPNIDDPLIFIDNLYDQLLARRKSVDQLENMDAVVLNTSNSSSTKSTSNNFNSTIGCNLSTDSVHDEDIENEELEINKPTITLFEQDNPNNSLNNANNNPELYYNQNDFSHINLYSDDTNVSDAVSLSDETNLLDINQNLIDWNYDTTTDICSITNNINNTLTTKLNSNLGNIDQFNDKSLDSSDINLESNDSFNQIDYYEIEACNEMMPNTSIIMNRDANNNYDNSRNLNLEEENAERDKKYESNCELQEIEVKNSVDRKSLEGSSSTSIATWPSSASVSSINTFDSVSKLSKSINFSSPSSSSISSSSSLKNNLQVIEKIYLKSINQNDLSANYKFVMANNNLIKPIYYVNTISNFPCNFLPLSYFLKPFNNIKNSINYLRLAGQKSLFATTTGSMSLPIPQSPRIYHDSTNNLSCSSSSNLMPVSSVNSTPKFINIIFDSLIKSIKFLILTKNVIFVPLLLFLLNSKANDTLMASDRTLNLLTFNDTKTTIAATAIFSTLMTFYCP
jgi:hypothetical protein